MIPLFRNRAYICALDIGSSKVAACLAQRKGRHIERIWFDLVPSAGIRDGVIVDPAELVSCITALMQSLKKQSGVNITSVFTSIPANEVITRHSRAIIPLAERGAKLISERDVCRVQEQARILGSSLDEEIMHGVPVSFTVDSKSSVVNPIGLFGHKLEVDLLLVCGRTATIQNLDRVVHQAGYEIADIFFSGMATAQAVFTPAMKEGISVLCDIGSDTTELMIFSDGILRDVDVLSAGGNQLTYALRDQLKIPLELAEEIKKSYGAVGNFEHIADDKEILVKKSNLYKPIKQRLVAQIAHAEAVRMSLLIKDVLEKKIPSYEINHFVAVGRTALLEGFIELLEQTLAVPVGLGAVSNPRLMAALTEQTSVTGQNKIPYVASLGILCEAWYGSIDSLQDEIGLSRNPLASAAKALRAVYQDYF